MLAFWHSTLCFFHLFSPRIHWAAILMPPRPWSGSSPSSTCGTGCWSQQRSPPWPTAAPQRSATSPPGPTTTWTCTAVPPRSLWTRATLPREPTPPAPNSEGRLGEVSRGWLRCLIGRFRRCISMYHIGVYSIFVWDGKIAGGRKYGMERLSRWERCMCFVFSVGVHARVFTSAVSSSGFSHRITLDAWVAWTGLLWIIP